MKIKLGNYKNHWISPYKIIEKVVFWKDWEKSDYSEPWVDKTASILEPICQAYYNVMNKLFPRKEKIRIDPWDTWSMDHTLAPIILAMLKQLKETKHGAPFTDDEDVPDHLKSTAVPPKENDWDTDDNHFKRWDYILDEMIWAFDSIIREDEYEDQHWIEKGSEPKFVKLENGNHTIEYDVKPIPDIEARKKHYDRQQRGLILFGKYYRNLWD